MRKTNTYEVDTGNDYPARIEFSSRPAYLLGRRCAGKRVWRVELWADGQDYPYGTAFVITNAPWRSEGKIYSIAPEMYYVAVSAAFRRQGIGMMLLNACRQRWPNIEFSPAICAAGKALLCAFSREIGGQIPEVSGPHASTPEPREAIAVADGTAEGGIVRQHSADADGKAKP